MPAPNTSTDKMPRIDASTGTSKVDRRRVDHHPGQPVGGRHHGERHQPQDGAAVGDDQQHGDDEGGDDQQPDVGAREGGGGVGLETDGAGQLGPDAGGQVGRGGRPQPVRLVDGRVRSFELVQRDDGDDRGLVLADLRAYGGRGRGELGERADPVRDRPLVVRGQDGALVAVGAGPDQQARRTVRVRETAGAER